MKLASTAADPETTQKIRITKAYTVAVLNHDRGTAACLSEIGREGVRLLGLSSYCQIAGSPWRGSFAL